MPRLHDRAPFRAPHAGELAGTSAGPRCLLGRVLDPPDQQWKMKQLCVIFCEDFKLISKSMYFGCCLPILNDLFRCSDCFKGMMYVEREAMSKKKKVKQI